MGWFLVKLLSFLLANSKTENSTPFFLPFSALKLLFSAEMRRFKVVLIGDSDVGKSSTFIRFRDGKFDDYIQSTIGLDFATREISFQANEDDPETETKAEVYP